MTASHIPKAIDCDNNTVAFQRTHTVNPLSVVTHILVLSMLLISQLEILGEKLSQEDVNQKLLRSLSPEWSTHVVVWRNKADLETMSMDDLYNNLKVFEPEVKGMSSSSSSTQNMAFMSSSNNNTSSTNGAVKTANEASTASTQVNAAYSTNIDNLSNIVICSFFASQPHSPQLIHEDLEQICLYDIEEMDLRCQMAMLTMRAKKECKAPRNQDNKHKESSRRSVPVEASASTALVSCDGLGGYDWSDQAEEGPNYEFMAFSSSNSKIVDNYKKELCYENYNAVPPPYIGNFMPPTPYLSYTGLDEFVNKPVVENYKAKSSEEETQGNPQMDLHDQGVIDNGCSRHMKRNMSYVTDYEEIDGGYVAFGGNPKGGKIIGKAIKDENSDILKSFITRIENLVDHKVKVIRCDNRTEFKNREMNQFCKMKGILRQISVARTPQQNEVAERRNRTLIAAARTMLADSNKAFRVFNSRTMIVEENVHIRSSESKPNVVGSGLDWLFDIDALTSITIYESIVTGTQYNGFADQDKEDSVNSTNNVNDAGKNEDNELPFDPNMYALDDVIIFNFLSDDEDDDTVDDMNNLDTTIQVSPIPTIRFYKDHPLDQVIEDLQTSIQTRKMSKNLEEHGFVSSIQPRTDQKDLQNCLYACFLSQKEPRKVIHALKDLSWIEALLEEFLQFKLQEVWTLVDLPNGKRAIGTKWVFRNKNDERGTKIRNKARLVTQGYQVNPKVSHLYTVKRIFRYSKGQPKLGLWYPKDSPFDMVSYTDNDYVRASLNRKSTTGDETTITASSLRVEQDSSNITKTQSKATPNESSYQGTNSGGDPRAKKLEKRNRLRTHKLKRLYKVGSTARVEHSDDEESLGEDASKQGRIEAIDQDEDITLVNDQDDANMFDVNALGSEKVFAAAGQNKNVVNITTEELTLAQALKALKTSKPNVKGLLFKSQNIQGYKLNDLKLKEFDSIKEIFDRAFRRVNTFFNYKTKLVKQKEKRAREELIQESTNKQKVEDDKEKDELKQLMETIPDEEVAIDVIPLAVKSPRIVDWKIHKERKKSYYQIVRADKKS
nr:hypothetical protein [Tanacetum cinerariifolium]